MYAYSPVGYSVLHVLVILEVWIVPRVTVLHTTVTLNKVMMWVCETTMTLGTTVILGTGHNWGGVCERDT